MGTVTTLLSVVSGYHDTLITKRLDPSLTLPPHPFLHQSKRSKSAYPGHPEIPPRTQPVLPPTSDHNRYTRYWTARSSVYARSARVLTTLSYIQLLLEMLAKRKGERVRWRLVLVLESIKLVSSPLTHCRTMLIIKDVPPLSNSTTDKPACPYPPYTTP